MNTLGFLIWAALLIGAVYAGRWLFLEALKWRPRAVYRIYDADGVILYIGSCFHVHTRMVKHRARRHSTSLWFDEANARFLHTLEPDTVRWYRSAPLAFAAETEAIRREQPRGNKMGVTRKVRMTDG